MAYPNHTMQPLKDRHICVNLNGYSWHIVNVKKKKRKNAKFKNESQGNKRVCT